MTQQSDSADDAPGRGAILLYRPLVHWWWILRHWRTRRPCALVVLAVFVHAILSLLSVNCVSSLITQVLIVDDAGVVRYHRSNGLRAAANKNKLPDGYYESCVVLVPVHEQASQAVCADVQGYRATQAGMWRHVGSTLLWILTGVCRRQRPCGKGVPASTVFHARVLWTSGSLAVHGLAQHGYDVTQMCGAPMRHFRNCDFLKLVKSGDFVRLQ